MGVEATPGTSSSGGRRGVLLVLLVLVLLAGIAVAVAVPLTMGSGSESAGAEGAGGAASTTESTTSTTTVQPVSTTSPPTAPPTPGPTLAPTPAPTSPLIGAFYTEEELARWRARAAAGPFKASGDAFLNSPAEWGRLSGAAQAFPAANEAGPFPGIEVPLSNSEPGDGEALRGGQFGYMLSAAFVDLVDGTTTYTAAIKEHLLAQARTPGTDFSNATLFPRGSAFSGNPDGTWNWAEWLKLHVLAYDYVGRAAFSLAEQTELDEWFREAGEWHRLATDERVLDPMYVERGVVPLSNTTFNHGNYFFAFTTGNAHLNGEPYYAIQTMYNNRRFAQTNLVAHIGVMLGDAAMVTSAVNSFKEYLAFHLYPDGHFAELMRSTADRVFAGLAYGANTLANVVEIAHVLHLHGYENLFEFETRVGLNTTSGDILPDCGVTKSLEWVFLSFLRNYMLPNSTLIYPADGTASPDQALHFCLSEDFETRETVIRMYFSAAMANYYYKNPLIESMYFAHPGGNFCNFTENNSNLVVGPLGKLPSALLQYGVKWSEGGM
jgi:hypothetical protein